MFVDIPIIRKCLQKHSCDICLQYATASSSLSNTTLLTYFKAFTNDDMNLYGKLIVPTEEWFTYIEQLEQSFIAMFPNVAAQSKVAYTIKQHIKEIDCVHPCPDFPKDYLLSLFVRLRIYFCLKFSNRAMLKTYSGNRKLMIVGHL